ncbi:MAG: C40 family peptidase [Pseudomonadota bacterium]
MTLRSSVTSGTCGSCISRCAGRTGLVLALLLVLVGLAILSGCATAPNQPPYPPGPPRLSAEEASDVTIYAISLVGTPYRYGGNTPASGFDCSGLIGHVYKTRANIGSPRTVAALTSWGRQVASSEVRTGDLVVFVQNGVATHAGIYVGENRFVHAPSTGGEVRLDRLTSVYWSRQAFSFRRP